MKIPESVKDLEEEVLDSSRDERGYRNRDYDEQFEKPSGEEGKYGSKSIVYDGE